MIYYRELTFDNGTVLNGPGLSDRIQTESRPTPSLIKGTSGDDTLTATGVGDTIEGGLGFDVVRVGRDTVINASLYIDSGRLIVELPQGVRPMTHRLQVKSL